MTKIKQNKKVKKLKIIAASFGIIGFITAVLTPILPIKQQTATINWTASGKVENVISPLISLAPTEISVKIPCSVVKTLPKNGGVILSGAAKDGRNAQLHSFFITATEKNIIISTRNTLIGETSRVLAESGKCGDIIFQSSTLNGQFADFTGIPERPANLKVAVDTIDEFKYTKPLKDRMINPTIVGLFTDLPSTTSANGIDVKVEVDSRYNSIPHPIKKIAIFLGIISTILALIALGFLDRRNGYRLTKGIPSRWKKFYKLDIAIISILVVWFFMGVNTSDDGYQYTMARMINTTGYMPNYFRWLGTPEDPVGWYYHIFAWMLKISGAALWMRVPALVLGTLGWLLISREALPRLGKRIANNPISYWASGMGFLIFWLPFNNGNRPETLVTVLMLLSWLLAEHAIATKRSLPIALSILVAAFSFGAAPGGMVAIIGLIVCFRRLLHIIIDNCKINGILPTIMPILSAGTFLLFIAFADQTIAGALEASRVKYLYGPSLNWWEELVRYYYVMIPSVDGALVRRFAVLSLIYVIFTIFFILLRRKRLEQINRGVLTRFLTVVVGSLLFMTITPTKWTHHFGLYATFAGVAAGACAVLVSPAILKSKRNRFFFIGIFVMLVGVSFTGINAYWFMGNFGQPWSFMSPNINGFQISLIFLWLGLALIVLGAFYHLRGEENLKSIKATTFSPMAFLLTFMVLFQMGTTTFAAIRKHDSFSWAINNYRTLKGNSCGLANEVLIEADSNRGFLTKAAMKKDSKLTPYQLLSGYKNTGFSRQNVPLDATKEQFTEFLLDRNEDDFVNEETTRGNINDNKQRGIISDEKLILPFKLNPNTPFIGSFLLPGVASLESNWYSLPTNFKDNPLIVVTAAGNIYTDNELEKFGYKDGGQKLVLQYAHIDENDNVSNFGEMNPIDIGPMPSWRNLRFPTKNLPSNINAVKIVAADNSIAEGNWLAFTPPRIPELTVLNNLLGNTDPIVIDWAVAIAFPCQQPMGLRDGILEVPTYRISPDNLAKVATDSWQGGGPGGGILGTTDLYLGQYYLSTYMRNNWAYDWGQVTKYTNLEEFTEPVITHGLKTRSGLWKPGKLRASEYNENLL